MDNKLGVNIRDLPLVCDKCGKTMKLDEIATISCGADEKVKAGTCNGKKHSGPRQQ